jgi:hypothetical protein
MTPPSPSSAHLLDLIKQAVVQIESQYATHGRDIPTVFGGDSQSSTESFPGGDVPSAELLQGVNLLKAATGKRNSHLLRIMPNRLS